MKLWAVLGNGEIQNTIKLHQAEVDGDHVSDYLVKILAGDTKPTGE